MNEDKTTKIKPHPTQIVHYVLLDQYHEGQTRMHRL
jgi:hypothetical protein